MSKLDIKGPYLPYNKDKEPISFYTSAEGIYFNSDLDQTLSRKVDSIKQEVITYASKYLAGSKGDSYGGCETKYAVLPKDLGGLTQLSYAKSLSESSWLDTSPTADSTYPYLWKRTRERITSADGSLKLGSPVYEFCGAVGETGVDGNGREWVFRRTAEDSEDSYTRSKTKAKLSQELTNDYTTNLSGTYQNNDHVPSGWDDDELEPTANEPLIWAASRTYNSTTRTWRSWGTPYLYNRRTLDGTQTNVIYTVMDNSTDTIIDSQWEADKAILIKSLTLKAAAGVVQNFPSKGETNYQWRDDLSGVDTMAMVYQATAYFVDEACTNIDTPVRITGENGIGSDGADMEFAYCSIDVLDPDWTQDTYQMVQTNPEQHYNNTSLAENLWVDSASNVTFSSTNCYMYGRQRLGQYTDAGHWYWKINGKKYGKGDDVDVEVNITDTASANYLTFKAHNFGWGNPYLFSRWGVDGVDGDGREQIYLRLSQTEFDWLVETMNWGEGSNGTWPQFTEKTAGTDTSANEYLPHTTINGVEREWTDDPTGVDEGNPYEYTCIRTNSVVGADSKKYYPSWDVDAHKPTVWNNFNQSVSINFYSNIGTIIVKQTIEGGTYTSINDQTTIRVRYTENSKLIPCDSLKINDVAITAENYELLSINSNIVVNIHKLNDLGWNVEFVSCKTPDVNLVITGIVNNVAIGSVTCSILKKPQDGAKGQDGKDISSVNVYYALGDTSTTQPADSAFTHDTLDDVGFTSTDAKKFLWSASKITYSDGTTQFSGYASLGQCQNFTSGEEQYAWTSNTTAPSQDSSAWQTTYPSAQQGIYIWTRTKLTWTNGKYSYTDAKLSGYIAVNGTNGTNGKDGTKVSNVNSYYVLSDSNTVMPSDDTFKNSGQDTATSLVIETNKDKYLWSGDCTTYTDKTTFWSGKYCVGQCKELTSVTEQYVTTTSNATPGTSAGWTDTYPQSLAQGTYVWSRDKIVWKNNNTTYSEAQFVAYVAKDGETPTSSYYGGSGNFTISATGPDLTFIYSSIISGDSVPDSVEFTFEGITTSGGDLTFKAADACAKKSSEYTIKFTGAPLNTSCKIESTNINVGSYTTPQTISWGVCSSVKITYKLGTVVLYTDRVQRSGGDIKHLLVQNDEGKWELYSEKDQLSAISQTANMVSSQVEATQAGNLIKDSVFATDTWKSYGSASDITSSGANTLEQSFGTVLTTTATVDPPLFISSGLTLSSYYTLSFYTKGKANIAFYNGSAALAGDVTIYKVSNTAYEYFNSVAWDTGTTTANVSTIALSEAVWYKVEFTFTAATDIRFTAGTILARPMLNTGKYAIPWVQYGGPVSSQIKQTADSITTYVKNTTASLQTQIEQSASGISLSTMKDNLKVAGIDIEATGTDKWTDGSVTVTGNKFKIQNPSKETVLSCDSTSGNLNVVGDITASSFLVSANAGTTLTTEGDWTMAITTWAKAKTLSNGTNSSISSDVTDDTPVFLVRQGASFFVLNPLSLGKGDRNNRSLQYLTPYTFIGSSTQTIKVYFDSTLEIPETDYNLEGLPGTKTNPLYVDYKHDNTNLYSNTDIILPYDSNVWNKTYCPIVSCYQPSNFSYDFFQYYIQLSPNVVDCVEGVFNLYNSGGEIDTSNLTYKYLVPQQFTYTWSSTKGIKAERTPTFSWKNSISTLTERTGILPSLAFCNLGGYQAWDGNSYSQQFSCESKSQILSYCSQGDATSFKTWVTTYLAKMFNEFMQEDNFCTSSDFTLVDNSPWIVISWSGDKFYQAEDTLIGTQALTTNDQDSDYYQLSFYNGTYYVASS